MKRQSRLPGNHKPFGWKIRNQREKPASVYAKCTRCAATITNPSAMNIAFEKNLRIYVCTRCK